MTRIDRRSLLKLTGAAAVGAAFAGHMHASSAVTGGPSAAVTTAVRWPGHQPGKVYLGVSTGGPLSDTLRRTGPVGLYRTYHTWKISAGELKTISADHKANRMPWVSFKPPNSTSGAWSAIAAGKYDADIRARARAFAGLSKPVIVTFNHEPADNHPTRGADFSRAWCRIHDIMRNETNLRNVVSVPIIGDWTFNPLNKQHDHRDWATPQILDRCHFFGVDLYQNRSGDGYATRLGRVLNYLDSMGHPQMMVGLGETGATDDYPYATGASWWKQQWTWSVNNSNRLAAISYFNSTRNNNSGSNWLLWQSKAKLDAFIASLRSASAATLR